MRTFVTNKQLRKVQLPQRRCPRRVGSATNAILIALLFLAGVAIALTFDNSSRAHAAGTVTATLDVARRQSAGAALGAFVVRDIHGQTVPIVTKGEPAIIMVSSRTCEWCKKTFSDLHELSHGRPLTHLKLLTLEGASEGVPMLAAQSLQGVELIGPNDGTDEVFLTFRYPGTPTFLAVDRNGMVSQTIPGYMERDALRKWFNVMVGDAIAPN